MVAPFDNPTVRWAISYAIDRQQFAPIRGSKRCPVIDHHDADRLLRDVARASEAREVDVSGDHPAAGGERGAQIDRRVDRL